MLGFTPGNIRLESCVQIGVNTHILQMHYFLSFVYCRSMTQELNCKEIMELSHLGNHLAGKSMSIKALDRIETFLFKSN